MVARPFDLRTVRIFRLESIVEEPAKRYKVRVDHDLVDALMEDAPKEDALPLLAFALQRLWQQYAASGALTRDNYERIGGLKALIEDAAERALRGLDADPPLPSAPPSKRVIDLGAATFVPPLAQVNEQGATIRRIATWASFDDEQQELLLRFDRWRLVIRKGKEEAGGGTVEVAHEALFREWTRLKSWLEPERARLDALRSLEIDASTWDRNGRDAAFLTHREKRLAEANALVGNEGYGKRLGKAELDYLAACQAVEQSAHRRARGVQGLVGVLVLGTIASLLGVIFKDEIGDLWFEHTTLRSYIAANFAPHVLKPEAERALKPGDPPFQECAKDCPEMIVIPAGEFWMGSPDGEGYDDEHPRRKVKIDKPFAVGKFEVTWDEWEGCVAMRGCDGRPTGAHGERRSHLRRRSSPRSTPRSRAFWPTPR